LDDVAGQNISDDIKRIEHILRRGEAQVPPTGMKMYCDSQQYPPGTQEKYNSFQSRIPVMEDGMKKGIDERRGGVWKPEGFPMKGLEPGVPPIIVRENST